MNFKTIAAALSLTLMTYSNAAASTALGAFFTSDDDVFVQFYRSVDNIHMDHIAIPSSLTGRDPSLRYHNGVFYICLVDAEHTFRILRSRDLIGWDFVQFNVIERGKYPAVWAPDLFIDDDGSAYVYFAKQKGLDKKSRQRTFDIYVSSTDDIEQPDFRAAQKITLDGYDNVIDAHVAKLDGRYYMIVKNEAWLTNNENKSPALFRSYDPIDNFVEVKEFPLRAVRGCEGFSIVHADGRVYIYGDNYSGIYDAAPTSHHTVWIADELNIETGPYRAEYVLSERPMRHGSLVMLEDPSAEALVEQLPIDSRESVENPARTISFDREDYGFDKGREIVIEDFAPALNVEYRVPRNTHVEIKNLINAYGVERIGFTLRPGASIDIENILKRENSDAADKYIELRFDGDGWSLAPR